MGLNIRKEYIQVDCKSNHCKHYGKCCKVSTTLIYTNSSNIIDLALIGQGAGKNEDIFINPGNINREPFFGRAGIYLRNMLMHMWKVGKPSFNVMLSNTVRCHPVDSYGKDRIPTKQEIEVCIRYLNKDILHVLPRAIITLGKSTTNSILNLSPEMPIGRTRGKVLLYMGIPTVPTYHPSYLCRSYGAFTSTQTGVAHRNAMDDIKLALREAQNNLTLL